MAVFLAPQHRKVQPASLLNKRGNRVTARAPCGKKTEWVVKAVDLAIKLPFLHACVLWEFFRSRATLQLSHACCCGVCPLPVAPPSPSSHPLLPRHSPLPPSFVPFFSFQSASSSVVPLALVRELGEGSRDCWDFFFFPGGGRVIRKMAPVVTG